jgi:uncharacterized protein YcbX
MDETVEATHFGKKIFGHAVGVEADKWFGAKLGTHVRLFYQMEEDERFCDPVFAPNAATPVSAADGFPFTVATDGSLAEVNQESGGHFTQENFRANIVVGNAEARAENGWKSIAFGEAQLECVKPCTRCQVTTVDLETGTFNNVVAMGSKVPEPLKTILRTRWIEEKVANEHGAAIIKGGVYAENAVPTRCGEIKVGDPVRVLATKPLPQWRPSPHAHPR